MELISNSASDAFKAHLRSVGASYLIAGEETLDMEIAVRRIGEVFGVDELILGGGGTLNWSMVRDELSIVMMPLADGGTDTNSLFEASGEHSSPLPIGFALKGVEPLEDGSLWLRYDVTGPVAQEQS